MCRESLIVLNLFRSNPKFLSDFKIMFTCILFLILLDLCFVYTKAFLHYVQQNNVIGGTKSTIVIT